MDACMAWFVIENIDVVNWIQSDTDRIVRGQETEIFFQSNCTNDVCYRLFEEKLNWTEAKYVCDTYFRDTHHLVTIDSPAEQAFVAELISSIRFNDRQRVWIGLTRNTSNLSVFDWVDGSPFSYTNWYQSDDPLVPTEPSTEDEECVNIFMEPEKFGYWNDDLCGKEYFFMCEGPPGLHYIIIYADIGIAIFPLNVTIPQSSYSVFIGNSVTLICNVTSDFEILNIYWERTVEYNNESSVLTIDSLMLSNLIPLNVTIPQSSYSVFIGNSVTLICNVTSDFEILNIYWERTVEYNNESSVLTIDSLMLSNLIPLNVTIPQSSYSVFIGNSVTLICNVTSDFEILNIYWERTVEYNNESSVLTIDSLMLSNLIPLNVTIPQSSYSVFIGNSVTLICNVTSDFEILNIYWERTVEYNNESSVLTIDSLMLSNLIPLNVTIPQSSYSVFIGNSVTLICNVTSDFEILNIYWERTVEYNNESSVLTIDSLMLSNLIRLNVSIPQSSYSVFIGNSVTLICNVTSDFEILNIYWERTVEYNNESSVLTIDSLMLSNLIPLNVTIPQSSYSVFIGNSVTLICNVTSDFEILNIYWERTVEYNNESSVLTIDSLMLSNLIPLNVTIPQSSYSVFIGNSVTLICNVTSDFEILNIYWERTVEYNNESSVLTIDSLMLSNLIPLNVTIPQSSYSVFIGNSVTLICNVTSDFEILNIYWERTVEYNNESSVLTIDSLMLSNLIPLNVTIPQSSYSVFIGNSVTLICNVTSDFEILNIYWERTVEYNNESSVLTIDSLMLSNLIPLNVTIPQSSYSVFIGNSVTLICNVTSDFEILNIYWERTVEYNNESSVLTIDSLMLSNLSTKYSGSKNNTPSLTIFDVEKKDEGIYTCFASNEYEVGNSSDINLTVNGKLKESITSFHYDQM
ncbi:unnamed protein product [Mytilus coruscus]|uniref:Uncharacterized protein n=1 Tax=Mytilus coruscus TaxID=42192 RepID=A0A6J8BT77_MYTCO|nr:unnamed protein product [Mytilus coruscus]